MFNYTYSRKKNQVMLFVWTRFTHTESHRMFTALTFWFQKRSIQYLSILKN